MGLMRFIVDPASAELVWPQAYRSYITSYDGRVHPTRIDIDGGVLNCRRNIQESGKLHLPWPVEGFGWLVVSTTSLPERERPYVLALELARGKLAEVREQAATWQQLRMVIPEDYTTTQQQAFQLLAQASASQDDLALTSQLAQKSLEHSFAAADMLTRWYVLQRTISRPPHLNPRPSLFGSQLDPALVGTPVGDAIPGTLSSLSIPFDWTSIEPTEGQYNWDPVDRAIAFGHDHRMVMRGGPLIDLGPGGLPEWLRPWANDILNLPSFICDFVETAIARSMGHIRLWEVAAHANTGGALALSEDHRLAIVARVLETAVRTNSDGQFFLRIDQPWGEYQARGHHRLSPLQFVDALLRSNLGLTGINLEIAMGYQPAGSMQRDLFSLCRLIDQWSLLGIQLHVTLACPSSHDTDPNATGDLEVMASAPAGLWTESQQTAWYSDAVSLLLAKPAVTGVFVSHLSDALPHRYPNAGLFNALGQQKPVWEVLSRHHSPAAGI